MNVNFKVNETDYRVTSDKYQLILNVVKVNRSGKNVGEERLEPIGYHRTIFEALHSVLDLEIYTSECKTMDELEKRYKDTLDALNGIADKFRIKECK